MKASKKRASMTLELVHFLFATVTTVLFLALTISQIAPHVPSPSMHSKTMPFFYRVLLI